MRPSTHDGASTTGRWSDDERLVDLLAEGEDDQDDVDRGRLYPMRLVQGDDDVRAETSYDRGGWSAEECAMHLVEEE